MTSTETERYLGWMRVGSVRLAERVVVTDDGCAEFPGCLNSRGYGVISINGKRYLTHRVAYEATFGLIPDGLTIDHLCRNKKCCNPFHLEAVTNAENMARSAKATKTACTYGHSYTPENTITKKRANGGTIRNCRACERARRECRSFLAKYLDRQPTADDYGVAARRRRAPDCCWRCRMTRLVQCLAVAAVVVLLAAARAQQ